MNRIEIIIGEEDATCKFYNGKKELKIEELSKEDQMVAASALTMFGGYFFPEDED